MTRFVVEFRNRDRSEARRIRSLTWRGKGWREVFSSPVKSDARAELRQRQAKAPHNKYRLREVAR